MDFCSICLQAPCPPPLAFPFALSRPGAEKLFAPKSVLVLGGREREKTNNRRTWAEREEVEGEKLVSKNLAS